MVRNIKTLVPGTFNAESISLQVSEVRPDLPDELCRGPRTLRSDRLYQFSFYILI